MCVCFTATPGAGIAPVAAPQEAPAAGSEAAALKEGGAEAQIGGGVTDPAALAPTPAVAGGKEKCFFAPCGKCSIKYTLTSHFNRNICNLVFSQFPTV